VEYWHHTGDASYNNEVAQAIHAQASPTNDFIVPQQTPDLVSLYDSFNYGEFG